MKKQWTRSEVLKAMGLTLGSVAMGNWKTAEAAIAKSFSPEFKSVYTPPKPVTAITLGAGNRGNVYGNYAAANPANLKIIGVAEPIAIRNERYAQKHGIAPENRFNTWEDVFTKPKMADAIIITTPDDLHYGPCMKALAMGYDVLLEKPISPSEAECRNILALAKKTKRIVAVCHVLRYAPYFVEMKRIIDSGVLGKLISVQHFEPIEHIHMSHSFVRGNWHNSKQTAPIILAKSCHDLDIIRWLVNKPAKSIYANGSLNWFTAVNAPEGSTDRCTNGCKVEATCPYSALKIYHQKRIWLHHFDLPEDKTQHGEAIMHYLKNSNFGRCVYKMDNDQPDHYVANILFDDAITVSFSMEALTSYHGRRTRIMGGLGDIVGDMNSFVYTNFLTGDKTEWKQQTDSHGGGDWRLVENWVEAVAKQNPSLLTSTIDQSIESHIMGFMAEKSRENQMPMNVKV
ncbi:MAG: Gfo/Idh/MocA family protein [Chitinophagaceae bacterium]